MRPATSWRSRSRGSEIRGSSPIRPAEWVERLSPIPYETSAAAHTSFASARDHRTGQRVQGLGLIQTNFPEDSYLQPDHLYFDQSGNARVGAKVRAGRNNRRGDAKQRAESSKYGKSKTHTRSGSTIDDLANIAIATSPQLSASPSHSFSGSPIAYSGVRPATSHLNGYTYDAFDRPAKRIKSEKLPSTEWYPRDERPRSSYEHHPQVRQEDAELLLSLRNGFTAPAPAIPAIQTSSVLQDSVRKRAEEFVRSVLYRNEEMADEGKPSLHSSGHTWNVHEHQPSNDETFTRPSNPSLRNEPNVDNPTESRTTFNDMAEKTPHYEEPAKPPIQAATGTAEVEIDMPSPVPPPKKQRKVKPEVQAEVCASCNKLQVDGKDAESTMFWLGCEACKRWFHYPCAGFKDKQEARSVDKFICTDCEAEHGQTTFVRKSSRARTAIDYAGLNEGVIKSSDDTAMHHYVPKLKDGSLQVLTDDFARVRPELLTREFWENMDGMKRPFVVPACWNPRFGDAAVDANLADDSMGSDPLELPSHVHLDHEGQPLDSPVPPTAPEDHVVESLQETVIDVDQDYLDMVMPRNLTVQKVAQLYGPDEPVPVIDVKSQETAGKWTLQQWANYYDEADKKSIRNVISLEVSNSRLGRLIRRPRAVREIDLEDQVWDAESRSASNKRPVQFYCLMSVADSYTDFHIDFGGSSVYYHILKGVKTFFFIPPEEKYLKKYEEWCMSTTQGETWLGDLCGGNVTRVDLHEGDTAFIPAGWIHSVWTPEDSLVIGGNYLTRYDFELQLKVASIEKTTNVPLKYRYPFFQKVMWYTLIQYLEEDPVPEDVLQDFEDDSEYRYLRANPVWMEQVDSSLACESDEAGFNTRNYSKSELLGLPSLRDYLYRTARIHSDLPVEGGINKKQSDAVKASIPKGYGDPMQLVKTFAVWCAWKVGNVTAPDWVHNDAGLQPELDKREKEKAKKPEVFRVPPERVSARQKAQASTAPTVEDRETTPGSSKGGSAKLACEQCRKKRVKCRHKEEALIEETAQQTLEKPRNYPNVGVDIAKLARASPLVGAVEVSPVPEPALDIGDNKDLAQAALARLNSQTSDTNGVVANGASPGSAKKGRSKACEECRKSKRRCVHDEYGRVDPAKAAEPSKPRGSSNAKRPTRLSDESSNKQLKMELDGDPSLNSFPTSMEIDSMIDPALMGSAIIDDASHMQQNPITGMPMLSDTHVVSTPPHPISAGEESIQPYQDNAVLFNVEGASPPVEAVRGEMEANSHPSPVADAVVSTTISKTPDHDTSYSPITVDGGPAESIEKVEPAEQLTHPNSASSRRSSRQPQQVDRYTQKANRTPSKSQPKQTQAQRRGSSVTSPQIEVMSSKSRRSSSNTSGTTHLAAATAKAAETLATTASSNIPATIEEVEKPSSRGSSAALSEEGTDEKLARELQAAEHGLRRRASVRA